MSTLAFTLFRADNYDLLLLLVTTFHSLSANVHFTLLLHVFQKIDINIIDIVGIL